jgi:hypothetical protein
VEISLHRARQRESKARSCGFGFASAGPIATKEPIPVTENRLDIMDIMKLGKHFYFRHRMHPMSKMSENRVGFSGTRSR